MRDNVMMYRTQCEAIRALPPEQFKAVVTALWDYEMDGVEPEGDPIVTAMFLMAKPLIDRRNAHYESGKKGGRPKTKDEPNDNQTETKENQTITKQNHKGKRIKDKGNIDINTPEIPYKEIVEYLNQKAGTSYRASSQKTQSLIRARFNEGWTIEAFKKVIDGRCEAWKGDAKMSQYLRPETLFGTKFESYLNAQPGRKTANKFVNFTGRTYDFDDLEKKLTGVM